VLTESCGNSEALGWVEDTLVEQRTSADRGTGNGEERAEKLGRLLVQLRARLLDGDVDPWNDAA